jgi:hypothetical protein
VLYTVVSFVYRQGMTAMKDVIGFKLSKDLPNVLYTQYNCFPSDKAYRKKYTRSLW